MPGLSANWMIVILSSWLLCISGAVSGREVSSERGTDLERAIKSIDSRLSGLESKFLEVNFVEQAFRMNNMNTKLDKTVASLDVFAEQINRIDSILSKLQLTDQEKRKWCDADYRESLISSQQRESSQLQSRLASMLGEIQDLIRSGISKLLVKTDSLMSDTRETKDSVRRLSTSGSSSLDLPSAPLHPSQSSGSSIHISPSSGSRTPLSSSNERSTAFDFRTLAENSLEKMVKQIEISENTLTKSVMQTLSTSHKLTQFNEETSRTLSELRNQITDLHSNAPIARILNFLQKSIAAQVDNCSGMSHDTYAVLEKAASQLNQMIRNYSGQVTTLNSSITNLSDALTRLDIILARYKSQLETTTGNPSSSRHGRILHLDS